ncbi:MAG: zinc-dependent peptidase, partial [Thauera sp.]
AYLPEMQVLIYQLMQDQDKKAQEAKKAAQKKRKRGKGPAKDDVKDGAGTDVDRGGETAIDPYGTEHPGEFFAVVSEVFFEAPLTLRDRFPAVYDQLAQFYGMDPAARAAPTSGG